MITLGVDGIVGEKPKPLSIEEDKKDGALTYGAIQSSLVQNTLLGSGMNHIMDYTQGMFQPTDNEFISTIGNKTESLIQDSKLSPERASYIVENAKNEEHYWAMVAEQTRQQDNADMLENAGITGTFLNIGFEVLDGIVTVGGLAKVAGGLTAKLIATGTGALQKVGLSAKASEYLTKIAGGIGIEVGMEYPKQQTLDSSRTELDYVFAAIGGGIGGALSKNVPALKEVSDDMGRQVNEALETKADIDLLPTEGERIAATKQVERNKAQQALEKIQFDYNKKFETSRSKTMRELTQGKTPIFYNPRFKTIDNFSADEINRRYNDIIVTAFNSHFKKPFADYQEINKFSTTTLGNMIDFKSQNEFYSYAGKVIHNLVDETNLPPEMLKLHGDIRAANAQVAEIAYDTNVRGGHPLFKEGKVEKNPDYIPIKYNLNKVFGDIFSGKIDEIDYVNLINNGLKGTLRNNGLTDDLIEAQQGEILQRATDWVSKQKKRVLSSDKQASSYIDEADIIDDYEEFANDLVDSFGISEEAARIMSKEAASIKVPSAKDGLSPRSRRRSNIDLTAKYTRPDGTIMQLADYVETNVDMLWKGYGQSMGGDIALRSLGITSRADIKALRATVEQELVASYNKMSPSAKSELAVFDDTMRQFLGQPLLDDPEGVLNKSVEVLQSGARTSYLGGTWFSMLSEVAAVTTEVGIGNILRYKPLRNFFKGYGEDTMDVSDLLLESRIYNGLGEDAFNHTNRYMYDADNSMGDLLASNKPVGFQDKVGKGLDVALGGIKKFEEIIMQVGGSKSGQAILEQAFYTGMSSKILRQVQSGGIDVSLAKEFGWSPKVAENIQQNILKHADIDGKTVNVFNFAKWDADAEIAYNLGMRRYASTLLQKPYIGDTSSLLAHGDNVLKNTWYGKLASSLMQYSIMAHSKQLGRTLANPDSKSLLRMTSHLMGATAGYYAYTYANFWDDPEELYKRTQGPGVAKAIMERVPASALIPMATGTFEEFTGNNLNEGATTTPRGISTPASIKVGKAIWDTGAIGWGLFDDDITISQKRMNSYLNTVLPNVLGMRYLNEKISKSLTTEEEVDSTWKR